MKKSEEIKNIAAALVKLQSEIGKAKKDKENPFYKSKYADLESIVEVSKQPLTDNELAITQTVNQSDKDIFVETTLIHAPSGEYITSSIPVIFKDKVDMQTLGSAITYARRYGIAGILNLIQEDDDGNSTVQSKPKDYRESYMQENQKPKGAPPKQRATPPPPTFEEAKVGIEKITKKAVLEETCNRLAFLRTEFTSDQYKQLEELLAKKDIELNII